MDCNFHRQNCLVSANWKWRSVEIQTISNTKIVVLRNKVCLHAYTVKFNLLSCLYICLVHNTVFMNITLYILTTNYTAVILISTIKQYLLLIMAANAYFD